MNAFERYFHGEHRAVRPYVLGKVFLSMVALDTWMLMIGHAGRYGVDGFNVAQFRWLDRITPLPSAALYVGVLVLTGLLALAIALAGTHPLACLALFLLYTFSWSMSMLDSYQHHYFVSAILLCLVFFPRVTASDVHALPPPLTAADPGKPGKPAKLSKKQEREQSESREAERRGWIYTLVCVAALAAYTFVPGGAHPWALFLSCAGTVIAATLLYPGRGTRPPALAQGFGFNLLGANIGILYTYTSIAKMDAQWCAGNTIQRISSAPKVFAPLVDWMAAFGLPPERFWPLFATSVIPVELTVAAGYVVSVIQDSSEARWPRRACSIAFGLAMTLHIGAEMMGLEIGWFSYYMMLLACVYLLPGPAIDKLGTMLTWPARAIATQLELAKHDRAAATQAIAISVGAAFVLGAVGRMIDLPGALPACLIAAGALIAVTVVAAVRKQLPQLRAAALGMGVAGALMWAAIALSPVRWDFYRYLGGDLRRRNQPEAALEAYERGERYAPPGSSRSDKIKELKAQLGR